MMSDLNDYSENRTGSMIKITGSDSIQNHHLEALLMARIGAARQDEEGSGNNKVSSSSGSDQNSSKSNSGDSSGSTKSTSEKDSDKNVTESTSSANATASDNGSRLQNQMDRKRRYSDPSCESNKSLSVNPALMKIAEFVTKRVKSAPEEEIEVSHAPI